MMREPLINVITRFSREDGIVESLQSLNEQTYSNIKHYITYQTTEGLEYLKSLKYKYPTEFIRVPDYKKIEGLFLYFEDHPADTDYLNWDWGKWDVQVVYNGEEPPRKIIECTPQVYEKDGNWCASLPASLRRYSHHAPYNLYMKIAEQHVKEGWISYLDDDDTYTSKDSIKTLAEEIAKKDNDTLHVFRMERHTPQWDESEAKYTSPDTTKPNNHFWHYMTLGHPSLINEIGSGCICFHSKWKEYTQWGHWTADDYRTVNVLEKTIPTRNLINEVLYCSIIGKQGKK